MVKWINEFEGLTMAEAEALVERFIQEKRSFFDPLTKVWRHPYHRSVHEGMANQLDFMYRLAGLGWINVPEQVPDHIRRNDFHMMRWWGLIADSRRHRPDGGRQGVWCVTEKGAEFLGGQVAIEQFCYELCSVPHGLYGPLRYFSDITGYYWDLERDRTGGAEFDTVVGQSTEE